MAGVCSGTNFPDCWADYVAPDPDIAGIGVTVSFVVVNALTIIVTTISIFFIKLEDLELSDVDLAINKWLKRRGLRPFSATMAETRIEFWLKILEKILLGLSDTQLLTGMAILIAGYVKCSISIYHSSIVSDLAWFASGTHLSSLQVLKGYLVEHPATRTLRVILILAMAGLLFSLVVYQGNQYWYDWPPQPAQCLFVDTVGNVSGKPALWMGLNIGFLVLGYSASILFLFPEYVNSSGLVVLWTRLMWKMGGSIKRMAVILVAFPCAIAKEFKMHEAAILLPFIIVAELVFALLCLLPLFVLWVIIFYFYLMINSYVVGVLFDVLWFAFGSYNLFADRAMGRQYMKDEDKDVENQMGFGQFVPIFLIFLPFMTAWEIWYEAYCDAKKEEERETRVAARTPSRLSVPPSPIHIPERRSSSVSRDEHRRDRAEGRAFDERLVQSLRPPPRAHYRSPSVESDTGNDFDIYLSPLSSTSQENLLPATGDPQHDAASRLSSEEDSAPTIIDLTGMGQSTAVVDQEAPSRRSTFRS